MGCIQMGYEQVQRSVSCSDSWFLKLVREMGISSFSDFCSSFQSVAAENWKERRPKEELAFGVTSEIYLSPKKFLINAMHIKLMNTLHLPPLPQSTSI